jgi:hypothetical protein
MGLICGAAGRAARPGRTRPTSPPRTWSSATSGSLTQPALGCRSAPPGHWGRVLWLVQRARRVANRIVGWATDPRARYITAGITPAVSKLAAAVSHPTSEAAYRGHRLETNQSGPDDHRSCFGIATARTRVPISCRKSTTPMQNGWRRRRGRMTVPDDLQPGAESQPVSAAGVDGRIRPGGWCPRSCLQRGTPVAAGHNTGRLLEPTGGVGAGGEDSASESAAACRSQA